MKKTLFINLRNLTTALLCSTVAVGAMAFPSSKYATSSVLSTGKWVKIAIPADGVYEITSQELMAMGFSNINNVQVYGNGGHMMSEVLNGTAIDDIKQVPAIVTAGKLCFYGKGPVAMTAPASETLPNFTRNINAYSTHGYYFLTEGRSPMQVSTVDASSQAQGTRAVSTSYDYFYHEKELFSYGSSGKDLFGEDIVGGYTVQFALPQVADNTITVNVTAAAKTKGGDANLVTKITTNGTSYSVPFSSTSTRIAVPTKSYNYCNLCSPIASLTVSALPVKGSAWFSLTPVSGSVIKGTLDNMVITYKRNNVIDPSEPSQCNMAFTQIASGDMITLPGATATTMVWNVANPNAPVAYELQAVDGGRGFVPAPQTTTTQWVAFDPNGTLRKIDGFQAVENQNIHAMPTPDMVIITNKTFLNQAQRIVDMHKQIDDLDIIVLDQEQIFNEFSSGTPDAMGYRLLCKMFYDRNMSKFKYLLLLGEGSYDNRGLSTNKKNRILTYQTDVSNHEDNSYPSDDFFGFLDDNSGAKVASALLRLGVGRIPSTSEAEAASDINKLIKYVLNPDYGHWRNSAMFMAETGDNDMHQAQTENIVNLIDKTIGAGFELNKVYIDMFPRAVNETAVAKVEDRTSSEAHRALLNYLERGQFYSLYVGHAGYRSFTHSRLWSSSDATSVTFPRLPVFTTACCDVARYDSDQRGIAEHMFHNPNGGAIALLTTSREVYSSSNDLLNQYWTKNLFDLSTNNGNNPTLGQAYMKAKQAFGGTISNPNKLKFVLFGDPAMKMLFPRPLITVTEINGVPVGSSSSATTGPMQQITVKAQVSKANLSGVDTDFNGNATLTIYDKERLLKNVTYNSKQVAINYPREILVQVDGRVVNGIFEGTAVMPRYCRAVNEKGLIRIYAHKEGTDQMVNGHFDNLVIGKYNDVAAITDEQAPVIHSMFLNDETFTDGAVVPANSTLYITATDDVAVNNQQTSMGNNMRLVLDGGKTSYYQVSDFATVGNSGRSLDIAFPLKGLAMGEHSLAYTMHDAAGNTASRTISFIVGNTSDINLNVAELPATTAATISATSTLSTMPQVNIKVTDALGRLVWTSPAASFPATWNLTDMSGKRVKGGVYKVWGNYNTGSTTGGTNITEVLVVDPVK